MKKVAAKCYLPANRLMLELIHRHRGRFKIAYSISGVAIEQMKRFAPEVLDSFRELAATGCVEFVGEAYYHSLAAHPHHNYYAGRAEADLTPWLEYFIATVADVFSTVREDALANARQGIPVEPAPLRKLDARARRGFALFAQQDQITTPQVAATLGLSDRMARNLLQEWVIAGWLVVAQESRRARAYTLSAIYRQFIGNLSAMMPREEP